MLRLLVASQAFMVCSGFAYAPNFITKIIDEQAPEIVRTRFPPEPNGYLHLGHAKAISFNFEIARQYGGTCNMRMDDTNPSKEKQEYIDSILEDVKWIQDGLFDDHPWNGKVRKTSDYFQFIYECAEALIESGDAYVDSLSAEEMREYRGTLTEKGRNSPYRERSVEENLNLFRDMRDGKYQDGKHVLRAKIAMDSPNINMRDPTLYRIKHESHPETGDQWCIYPMYDFSHPISDAVEEITHSLCTLEFEDHRLFYEWTIEKLRNLGKLEASPQQIEFSRLNIQSTVLSKRKLIQLVNEKHVQGWDDPRLPTLSGLRRRGLPPAALRLFCERVGISKTDSNIAYSVLEDCVRETMDSTCPRAFCILKPLKVTITNWEGDLEEFTVDRHPKVDMGKRTIPFGKSLYIERSDFFDTHGPEGQKGGGTIPTGFKRLLPDGRVRLRHAYVIECNEIVRDPDTNDPTELLCTYLPDTRAGNTPEGMTRVNGIIHWVEASTAVPCTVNQYDRLFSVEEPGKESGDFLKDINEDSLFVLKGCVVEPSVIDDALSVIERVASSSTKKTYLSSLAYQFERNGYFALDKDSHGKDNLIFNRVVTLRDTWGQKDSEPEQRNRGTGRTQAKNQVTPVEDIRRVSLRVATILSAEPHPEAGNLLVCQVDCGDTAENGSAAPARTVVAGLAGKIAEAELIGQKVIVATNLKPARMRGIESTAMLLAASNEGDTKVELLRVPETVVNGELVSFEGLEQSDPDPVMKSKGAIKAWERAKAGLRINSEGEAMYGSNGETHRMLTTAGPITTSTLKDAAIN